MRAHRILTKNYIFRILSRRVTNAFLKRAPVIDDSEIRVNAHKIRA